MWFQSVEESRDQGSRNHTTANTPVMEPVAVFEGSAPIVRDGVAV